MRNGLNFKTLLLLLVMVLVLAAPMTALAQEEDGHEDTTEDAGHAEEGGEEEEGTGGIGALGINTGFLIAQIINFLLIAGLLAVILWKPVVNMLDARSAKIEKGIEENPRRRPQSGAVRP